MNKILVVDDSKMNRSIARMSLEDQYHIIECDSGQKAIDLIAEEKPDLILLDVLMPEMNGFETCRLIKKNPKTKEIPVIFVTALEEILAKKEGFDIGADDYITKPYDTEELILRVSLSLKMKREQDSIKSRLLEVARESRKLSKDQEKVIEKEKELLLRQIYVSLHHEIRNPLTTILIGSQLLDTMKLKETEKKIISEIISCSKRIRDIMDSLGKMKNIVLEDYVKGTKMVKMKDSK